jgi:uncharacterized tellurite resistance protein B-like protein
MTDLLDLSSLSEDQRVAFYGAMFAIAVADGILAPDELDLIFQHINTDGLSEPHRKRVWDYLVETPQLTDCLACFATNDEQVRCALMVYLVEVALVDRILEPHEDEALLQARHSLGISQQQIEAVERYIVEIGLIRAGPRDYHERSASRKHPYGIWLLAALSIPVIALFVSSLIGGVSLPALLARFALPPSGLAWGLGAGATILIGTAAVLSGRWLYTRYQQKHLRRVRERRRRAQLAVRNLQDAVGYLTIKAHQHASSEESGEAVGNTAPAVARLLSLLQQMLMQRQPGAVMAASSHPDARRTSSR